MPEIARNWPEFADVPLKIAEQLEIDAKYAVYLDRQTADIESYRKDESFELPEQLDYAVLPGLSNETRQKLQAHRPRTMARSMSCSGEKLRSSTSLLGVGFRGSTGRRSGTRGCRLWWWAGRRGGRRWCTAALRRAPRRPRWPRRSRWRR